MSATQRDLPLHFAVPRMEIPDSLDYQILTARENGSQTHIENPHWLRSTGNNMTFRDEEEDNSLYTTTIQDSAGRPLRVHYWKLPHSFLRNGERIRVLDFDIRGWLPLHFLRIHPSFTTERISQIRRQYQAVASFQRLLIENPVSLPVPNLSTPENQIGRRRPRTGSPPPLFRYNPGGSPPSPIYDLGDGEEDVLPGLLPFPSPPRTLVQVRALAMPKEVGETLIEAAVRRGDECPILYNKLEDCDAVSMTSCFHAFDSSALNEWRTSSGICPCCRTPITNVITKRLRGQ